MPAANVRATGTGNPEPAPKTPGYRAGNPANAAAFQAPICPRSRSTLRYGPSLRCPMAVPKRRQSNQKTRSRRAHDFLTPRQLTFCSTCGKAVPTHRVCGTCGSYMGKTVIKTGDEA